MNEHKWFASGANNAAFTTVLAEAEPDAENKHRRFSTIIVPTVDTGARLLRATGGRGVPVPEVIASDQDADAIGGETIPLRILRSADLTGARAAFASQRGQILAAIHSIPLAEVEPLPKPDAIEPIQTMLDACRDRCPAFDLGLRWLWENRPVWRRRDEVHGNLRNGNMIVGPDGVRAVLEWELAHAGDPLEAFGRLYICAWRWGARPLVGGMDTHRDLLDANQREGGGIMNDQAVFWWLLLVTVWWGGIRQEQARNHLSGESRSVELAVLGRRATEIEYDVLRMLP